MIIGHFAIAAGAHATWRDSSLLWLLAAAIAPDAVDAMFVMAGICNPHGLYSHTLPAAALIAAVMGGVAFLATDRRATGLLAAALVLAHIPLDYVTGYKLFWPGGEIMGLHLYERPVADFVLEAAVVLGGWRLLRKTSGAPRWATGRLALVALLALQAAMLIVGEASGDGVKPSACSRVIPPAG